MTRSQAIRNRDRLIAKLVPLGDVLRGSLFERTIHHSSGCPKCARGEGHPLWVLNVGYPGGKTRQSVIAAGDELLGLMRAFLGTGSSSLVLSLWKIEDRFTGRLMESFYTLLASGWDKGAALREAPGQPAVAGVVPAEQAAPEGAAPRARDRHGAT